MFGTISGIVLVGLLAGSDRYVYNAFPISCVRGHYHDGEQLARQAADFSGNFDRALDRRCSRGQNVSLSIFQVGDNDVRQKCFVNRTLVRDLVESSALFV